MTREQADAVIEMAVDLWMLSGAHGPYNVHWEAYKPLVREAMDRLGTLLRPNREPVLKKILSA